MTYQKLCKVGNSNVVTIPKEEVERMSLTEGQLLSVEVHSVEVRPTMSPEVREALEESWARNEAAYPYLADR